MSKLELSWSTMIKFFLVLIAIIFLYYIREVLVLLFVVIILVTALDPLVSYLEKYKIPRFLSTFLIYLILICLVGLAIYLIIPPLIAQIRSLAITLPAYADKFAPLYQFVSNYYTDWQTLINKLTSALSGISGDLYQTTLKIFGGISAAVTVLILSFYILIKKKKIIDYISPFFPSSQRNKGIAILNKIFPKLGHWLWGQIVVAISFGAITGLILFIIGVPYALIIGIITGLMEFIPIVGPVISGIIAVTITLLAGSWLQALIVLALYILLQQLENYLLVPSIMKKAVGLSPVIIIIAILIGIKLAGILGAVLAIPVAVGVNVFLQEWPKIKNS